MSPPASDGPWVLGLAGSHNGAAALYRGADLVCAVQEERLSRKKRDVLLPGRPSRAVDAVLADQGLTPDDLALVVSAPLAVTADPERDVVHHPTLGARPTRTIGHHLAHALSAWATSGFEDTLALVVDGAGSFGRDLPADERAACVRFDPTHREAVSVYLMADGRVVPLEKHLARTDVEGDQVAGALGPFSSLGLMYQQVARFTFGSWDAAGKVMGLAPHGRAIFSISEFLDFRDDGALEFHDHLGGIGGGLSLRPFPADFQAHADLAASVQAALEAGMMHLAARAASLSPVRRLVCAGGVFLNGVANERLLRTGLFDEVFVVPFAEDSGTAVGAAFAGARELCGARPRRLGDDTLGPTPRDLDLALAAARSAGLTIIADDPIGRLVDLLTAGRAVGFLSGRSELGPRALGHRSILFDPRRDEALALNHLKGREAFRPFAPAVLDAFADTWFDLGTHGESPFMLRVVPVRDDKRALVPAVVHVDGTTRPQTVAPGHALHPVIGAFFARTGVPLLLNTSFNRAGEPIVETCLDALGSARAMGLGAVYLAPGDGPPRLAVLR